MFSTSRFSIKKRKAMSAITKSLPSQNIICLENKLSWRPEAVSLIQMESDWKPFLEEFGVSRPISYLWSHKYRIWRALVFLGRESNIWILTASLTISNVIRHHFKDCQVFLPLHWFASVLSQVSQFFLNAKVTSDTNSLTPPQHQGLKLTTRPFS